MSLLAKCPAWRSGVAVVVPILVLSQESVGLEELVCKCGKWAPQSKVMVAILAAKGLEEGTATKGGGMGQARRQGRKASECRWRINVSS